MRDRPDINELLELSRTLLRNELRAALPEEHKYTALMIANVIGVGLRIQQQSIQTEQIQAEQLAQILNKHGLIQRAARLGSKDLDEMFRELSTAIRQGKFDLPGRNSEALKKFLLSWTEKRVKLYNPGALD